mgnify:CR=1 FL=1
MNSAPVLLRVIARPLRVVIVLASVWILLRGHNAPGGGFIGGLVAVSGSILEGLVNPPRLSAEDLFGGVHVRLAAWGVALAAATGLPGLLHGGAYLTHAWSSVSLGAFELPVSGVLLFDVGVYLCVWGGLGGYARALLAVEPSGGKGAAP